jgi:hypothetical protein
MTVDEDGSEAVPTRIAPRSASGVWNETRVEVGRNENLMFDQLDQLDFLKILSLAHF